jgi:hypothetical protein
MPDAEAQEQLQKLKRTYREFLDELAKLDHERNELLMNIVSRIDREELEEVYQNLHKFNYGGDQPSK